MHLHRIAQWIGFASLTVVTLGLAACSEEIVEDNQRLGGTCLSCHDGITDVHPYFALSCVDCHGGDDQVEDLRTAINEGVQVNIRDQVFMKASHVLPVNPENWWANGIDDDDDGEVDELGEFFDPRLNETVGFNQDILDHDQEMNEDMNYLRFVNPGDLRVAQVGCGRSSTQANDAMVCHAEVVYDMRRSMMTQNSGVATGALYGNAQQVKASDFGAAFEAEFGADFDARNERIGRAGYTFDYDAIDTNFDKAANVFDRDALTAVAAANLDPNDDEYEATQGPLLAGQLAIDGSETLGYPPNLDAPGSGLTRLGNPTGCRFEDGERICDNDGDPNDRRAVELMQFLPNREFPPPADIAVRVVFLARGIVLNLTGDNTLADTIEDGEDIIRIIADVTGEDETPIRNPVDNVVRGFRPYHPVNWPGQVGNFQFGFVDFTTGQNEGGDAVRKDPNNVTLNGFNNNPFGRARSSGCTACHVRYNKLGHNEEPIDRTVADNGRQATSDLPYGMRIDLGQRWWAARHEITREVPIENCQICHAFVTRIDFAYGGIWENEDDDILGGDAASAFLGVQRLGPFSFETPNGTQVNVVDNVAVWQNGVLKNAGAFLSEDLNGNGELDASISEDANENGVLDVGEDLNGNGELDLDLNEDLNGNGFLDIPDRVRREDSADGRQQKFIYGGANGAILMKDVHEEAGLECVDCHGIQDNHGDGQIYSRNWDLIQIECDDCHGTSYARANLITTGPNGGQDLRTETTAFPIDPGNPTVKKPWFEEVEEDGVVKIIQNSRTEPELSWVVPQLVDEESGTLAKYSHEQPLETGSTHNPNRDFAHMAPAGEDGGLECYSCHSGTQPNCMTCHYQQDVAVPVGETFYSEGDNNRSDFQLFSYTRSPFYMGVSGDVEGNKIATHRSLMQLQYSTAVGGETLVHNFMASSQNGLSNIVSNPNFPHVVRTIETKSCARCHTLLDADSRIQNDHLVTEAVGQGSHRFANIGDWAMVATDAGLEILDVKREERGGRNVWPGFVIDDTDGVQRGAFATARRKATFGTAVETNDVAYVRGVSAVNGGSDGADVVILGSDDGLRIIEVTGRDNPKLPPLLLAEFDDGDTGGPVLSVDHAEAGTSQFRRAIFVTDTEIGVVDFSGALGNFVNTLLAAFEDDFQNQDPGQNGATIIGTTDHDLEEVTKVRLFGTQALVTHKGGVAVFDVSGGDLVGELGSPGANVANFETLRPAKDVVGRGRFLFVATGDGGIEIFDHLGDQRVSRALHDLGELADSRGVTLFGTKLLVADGVHGVRIVDIAVPEDPVLERTILNPPGGGAPINDANDIIVATVPIRSWALVADGANGLRAINLSPSKDWRLDIKENSRAFRLSFERQDPFTPFDPTNRVTQVLTFPTDAPVKVVARGFSLDTMADPQGNRWRDGWMPGANTLDAETVQRMRDVVVLEVPDTVDGSGDGLGCVVRDQDEASASGDPSVCTYSDP
jgi:hypothetical protein